jgi:hypothetical protein
MLISRSRCLVVCCRCLQEAGKPLQATAATLAELLEVQGNVEAGLTGVRQAAALLQTYVKVWPRHSGGVGCGGGGAWKVSFKCGVRCHLALLLDRLANATIVPVYQHVPANKCVRYMPCPFIPPLP